MNTMTLQTHKLIWISILPILMISFLDKNAIFDIQYHDTYFIFPLLHLGILFSIVLGIIGLIYWWISDRPVINWMKLVHIGVTIGFMFTFLITNLVRSKLYDLGFVILMDINLTYAIFILIFVGCQLLFLVNIFKGLVGSKKN